MRQPSAHHRHSRLFVLMAMLTGCTSTDIFIEDPALDPARAATLVVYTPDTAFNRQNFIKPTIYIDGKKLGKVSSRQALTLLIPAGKHSVAFQRSFPLMPVYEATRIDINFEAAQIYYLRYSYDFDDHVQSNDPAKTTGASSFRLVGKSTGEKRE